MSRLPSVFLVVAALLTSCTPASVYDAIDDLSNEVRSLKRAAAERDERVVALTADLAKTDRWVERNLARLNESIERGERAAKALVALCETVVRLEAMGRAGGPSGLPSYFGRDSKSADDIKEWISLGRGGVYIPLYPFIPEPTGVLYASVVSACDEMERR